MAGTRRPGPLHVLLALGWWLLAASCGLFSGGADGSPTATVDDNDDRTPARAAIEGRVTFGFAFDSAANDGRAVRVDSADFIDDDAAVLDSVAFDSLGADALSSGWLETTVGGGSGRWAGGPDRNATVVLDIPAGAFGILLHIRGALDGVETVVSANGTDLATFTSGTDWHTAFVPLRPSNRAIASVEPQWTDNRYFPAFPAASPVFVIPVETTTGVDFYPGSFLPGWRVNQSIEDMFALTLVGMQGLVNRHGAQVFLDWQDFNGYASYWLPDLEKEVDVVHLDLDARSAVSFLAHRYPDIFAGTVVYDPDVPDTINLATMFAGVEDRVMLAPEQLELHGIPDFGPELDLRDLVAERGWDTTPETQADMYQWAYDELWPDLEHRMVGLLSPGPPASGAFERTYFWPMELASRDYYVALKLPALYLDPVHEPQESVLRNFLSNADSPIPVLGGFSGNENGITALATEYGNFQAAVSWPGAPLSSANLSLFGGVRPDALVNEPTIRPESILATLGDGPVATMFSTDGDAVFFLLQHGFAPQFTWDEVQGQAFSWTINPMLSELAPVVWNHYVSVRSEVSLIDGLSGAGYIYPEVMPAADLDRYLARAAEYMLATGLRVVHGTLDDGQWDEELAGQFSAGLMDTHLLGMVAGYGGEEGPSRVEYWGGPAPSVWPSYVLGGDNASAIAEDLLRRKAGDQLIEIRDGNLNRGVAIVDDPAAGDGTRGAHSGQLLEFTRVLSRRCCPITGLPAGPLPGQFHPASRRDRE